MHSIATDDLNSIKSRSSRKLAIPGEGESINIQYLYCDVYYTLEDGLFPLSFPPSPHSFTNILGKYVEDDFEVFLTRHGDSQEVTLLLTSIFIPTSNPSIASVSSLAGGSQHHLNLHNNNDSQSVYSSSSAPHRGEATYGRNEDPNLKLKKGTSTLHLMSSSGSVRNGGGTINNGNGAASIRSNNTARSKGKAKSIAPSIPEHKIKFEEFHNQVHRILLILRFPREEANKSIMLIVRSTYIYRLNRPSSKCSNDGSFLPFLPFLLPLSL